MEDSTAMRDETTADYTPNHQDLTATPVARDPTMHGEESLLDEAELSGSTPRLPSTKTVKADMSDRGTPFDSMRREMRNEEENNTTVLQDEEDSTVLFAQRTAQLPDMSLTPSGQRDDDTAEQQRSARRNKDPLLHRVLDKNYRVQSTPHRPGLRISPLKKDDGKKKDKGKAKAKASWQEDDSCMSSPDIAPPTLRSEVFMSPYKLMARQRIAAASQGPRTPGVSVQTPVAGQKKSRDVFSSTARGRAVGKGKGDVGPSTTTTEEATTWQKRQKYEIDWESDEDGDDDDLYAGMSPPKTIQFALPPSKLLQTPGEFLREGTGGLESKLDCFRVFCWLT